MQDLQEDDPEMASIADMIDAVLSQPEEDRARHRVIAQVHALCRRRPVYGRG